MHELAITQAIVEAAASHAGGGRVTRVVVQIGKLSAVSPDAVRFCFDLCRQDTPLEDATLEIVETPGRGRCRDCGGEVLLERAFGRCGCGCSALDWLAGEELKIRTIEVD